MTILQEYYRQFSGKLRQAYDQAEAESITGWVFEEVMLIKRHQLKMLNKELTFFEQERLDKILDRLMKHEPLQYILGYTWFYHLRLEVNKNVLIPRRETEELVDRIIKDVKSAGLEAITKPVKILDIGTGSGCIAIALKKNIPHAEVTTIDISGDALAVAKRNAEVNGTQINFIQADILKAGALSGRQFNIIVSNPPYVREKEKKEMAKNVLDHEPHIALFVPDEDPLLFYRAILDHARSALLKDGTIYFEINESYARELEELCRKSGFENVEVINDMQGKPRMMRICC